MFSLLYIDPGSGSMLFQVLVVSAIGSIIVFRRTLANLALRIQRLFRPRTGPGKG